MLSSSDLGSKNSCSYFCLPWGPSSTAACHWAPSRSCPVLMLSPLPWQCHLCKRVSLTHRCVSLVQSPCQVLYSGASGMRCWPHPGCFEETSTQHILNQVHNFCLCILSSALNSSSSLPPGVLKSTFAFPAPFSALWPACSFQRHSWHWHLFA